jgi:hypothetical protein
MVMLQYVTLQQAKDHLRVDHDSEDNDITLKIVAASGAIKNYLKFSSPYEPMRDSNDTPLLDSNDIPILDEDSSGNPIVRWEVRAAVLMLLGIFYRDRDGQEMKDWAHGYLPAPITALLYPLRDPAIA